MLNWTFTLLVLDVTEVFIKFLNDQPNGLLTKNKQSNERVMNNKYSDNDELLYTAQ